MVIRYDKVFIKDFKEIDEGYLIIIVCLIIWLGVFFYCRIDGGLLMEVKLFDELFFKIIVFLVNVKLMIDDYLIELVIVVNYNKYLKGMIYNDVYVLDNKLLVLFIIIDVEIIKKINDGKCELSIGF